MATELEKVVYPQFLHPMKHITLTASILMIVSLSLERYCAVHSPMEFRQVLILLLNTHFNCSMWINTQQKIQPSSAQNI